MSMIADLKSLIENEVPEGLQSLQDSHINLEKVAHYCEDNYFHTDNKRQALEETKNFTTQSLASVAYQINTLAYNLLHMLDMQTSQLAEMESQINHISQTVMIHKEKVARREIGILTTNKSTTRQHKILAPANPERPIKYTRKPIDFSVLDDVGHGVRTTSSNPRLKRAASQVVPGHINPSSAGPAPTTKPPTPPQPVRATSGSGGSLSRGNREYRTPAPPIAPPQVPSNYAPNFPIGHPRAQETRRGSGYSTLPAVGNQPQSLSNISAQQPQVGMVHPMSHLQQNLGSMGPSSPTPPPPPMPDVSMTLSTDSLPEPPPHLTSRDYSGNVSPPLPPPPPEHEGIYPGGYIPPSPPAFLQPQRSSADPDWAPKTYIEKVIAIYDYMADKDDELSFTENALIYVIKKNDDGWYEGICDGITGLFPGNYVEPCL
ncbi:abl interactor 2-like isoform X1 [Limulus polyphemus]|uniref:Abl interactor 2-like isoform X1 n=2 Tax=Limulus polyphemus TaxID=6850 RepID=A0ABM1B195_LIMPO|nr:abl interactor 2-like isoform X1 [Limulus polyphemus]